VIDLAGDATKNTKRNAGMNNSTEQLTLTASKALEQGGAVVGGGLGIYQLVVEHQELIITMCALGGFFVSILGYLTASILNWYFNYQHLKIAQREASRRTDKPEKE